MRKPRIELVYFEGCPNAPQARDNLKDAIEATGQDLTWSEWGLMSDSTPTDFRQFGSPTVLVDGEDVTGGGAETAALACRSDGVPSVDLISAQLR
jgi:hypothetical protein